MTPAEAKDVILGIFKTVWDTPTPRIAVYSDLPGTKPASNVVWARAIVQHAEGRQSSLAGVSGTRRFTDEGTFFIQVFAPVGDGSTACLAAAREVQDAYRDAKHPNVWFRDVKLREVGADGTFYQINVSGTFSYDEVR